MLAILERSQKLNIQRKLTFAFPPVQRQLVQYKI